MIGNLPKRSFRGLPFSVSYKLSQVGIDPLPYLDHRARGEYEFLTERFAGDEEHSKLASAGCLETILSLPILKQIRETLPKALKDPIKGFMKNVVLGDEIEP